ncbi:MAG: threonine synthase [Pyrinomonadaceae bacterium]
MHTLLQKYKDFLPAAEIEQFISLGEGATPLVKSENLSNKGELYFKMEQLNPTGSFKDRFAALETALIKQAGIETFIATSSGNTGSALAAYSAKHGLRCLLFVNEIAPVPKLKQMLAYGAEVYRVKDFGVTNELSAPIFKRLQDLAAESGTRLVISAYKYSPDGMEGVKTIGYELVEQLGEVPENIFVPVGGGGLLSGIRRAFEDLKERKLIENLPKINGVQPELNDTIVTSWLQNADKAQQIETTTSISGLAVQVDIDATLALNAVKATGGCAISVTDEEIYSAQRMLATKEGVYAEPAGAASVAGYLKALVNGTVGETGKNVCILTGHGLKDTSVSTHQEIRDIDASFLTHELIAN